MTKEKIVFAVVIEVIVALAMVAGFYHLNSRLNDQEKAIVVVAQQSAGNQKGIEEIVKFINDAIAKSNGQTVAPASSASEKK